MFKVASCDIELTERAASPSNSPAATLSIHLEISASEEDEEPNAAALITSRAFGLSFSSTAVDILGLTKLNLFEESNASLGRRIGASDRQIDARNMREIEMRSERVAVQVR